MSQFTSILTVSPLDDGNTWMLRRAFGYHVGYKGSRDRITVPVRFETDFASVPRPLWWLLPPWGTYGNAAVIHDWLYWEQLRPRREADRIFLEAMTVLSVSRFKRTCMYLAVRALGGIPWWQNQGLRKQGYSRISRQAPEKSRNSRPLWRRAKSLRALGIIKPTRANRQRYSTA